MGDATGPVPFSSYMTTSRLLRENPDTVRRFNGSWRFESAANGALGVMHLVDRVRVGGWF